MIKFKAWLAVLPLLSSLLLASAASNASQGVISQPDVRKYNLGLGKAVFREKCIKCHGDIETGAPQLGSLQDWDTRIAAPVDALIQRALKGHGKMPPKGGFEELSDREVSAAVAYIVDQGRRLVITEKGELSLNHAEYCGDHNSTQGCQSYQVDNTLLLQMLWMITNKNSEI